MSKETVVKHYNRAKSIYKEIDESFQEFQEGKIKDTEFNLNQIINRLSDLKKSLRYIQIDEIKEHYPEKTVKAVENNVEIFRDALFFWGRFFLAAKYAKGLKDPVILKYIPDAQLEPWQIRKFGGTETEVAKNFISTIVHTSNIKEYERAIKRMIMGTMSQKEFNKIFDVLKYKMPSPKVFESIEDFYLKIT